MTRPPPRSTLFPYTPLFRSLLSVRLLLARPPRQPRLVRPQATRGETPPPSRPRPRPPAHQRPLGHAQQPTSLPAKLQTRRLRSEEHTSELQSRQYLVCRLLL